MAGFKRLFAGKNSLYYGLGEKGIHKAKGVV